MSDLRVNTISNPTETGSPDFTHMPTVAGTPVVESGSNSDGEWTRWADGTQQCLLHDRLSSPPNTASGSLYRSDPFMWTYPVAFTGGSSASAGNDALSTNRWPEVIGSDSTAATLVVWAASSSGTATTSQAMASGRWK